MKYNKLLWKMKVNQLLIRLGLREPDPIWYIGGSDVLPQPLPRAKEREVLEAARRAPNPAARRMMQRMAEREGAHARRLLAVYYLACGQCYRPALASGPGETLPWRQLLRQRYHQEVCAARQYDQAAQSVGDPCLAGLFRELSREEDCHARQLLGLLEQNILAF